MSISSHIGLKQLASCGPAFPDRFPRPASNRAGQLRVGRLDGPVPVFGSNDFPHELRRELRILVRKFNPDSFAVHRGQLMAKLVTDVALVADLTHGAREVAI